MLEIWCGWVWVVQASACNTDNTQTQPQQISNSQRTANKTTGVVIQQHSRKLMMMDIIMSETCWVHKKWNKIATDITLVYYSSENTLWCSHNDEFVKRCILQTVYPSLSDAYLYINSVYLIMSHLTLLTYTMLQSPSWECNWFEAPTCPIWL